MLRARQTIKGKIYAKGSMKGKLNNATRYIYPELENLHITPSGEKQHFKSDKYGYGEVTVNEVKGEELIIIPSTEEQVSKGLFNNVKVKGVTADIDANIKPEHIKEGVGILGVSGGYKGIDTSDATATADDILEGKTAYMNNKKLEGTIQKYDGSYEGSVFEGAKITDGQYLFYNGARTDYIQEILAMCEKITSAYYMFRNCEDLTELDVSELDTSQCTNMQSMFLGCRALTELDVSKLDTSQCTNMQSMFQYLENITELDLSNFNTSKCTNMAQMFYGCNKIEELDLSSFDTKNVTNMGSGMFYGNTNLKSVNLSSFDTKNVTNMSQLFYQCSGLTDLDLSNFDLSKVTNTSNMFYVCYSLANLKSFRNLGKGFTSKSNNYSSYKLDLSRCPLTYESAIDVLTNGLYDLNLTYNVANGGTLYTQSVQLHKDTLALLSETDIAIATAKGWTVS